LHYRHLFPEKIGKSISARWQKWQDQRLLRAYFRGLMREKVSPQPALFRDGLLVLLFSLLAFRFSPSFPPALVLIGLLTAGLLSWRILLRRKEDARLKKACFEQVAFREYEKRLAKTVPEVVLRILQDALERQFPIRRWRWVEGMLEGEWKGRRLAVVYLEAHGGNVAGREVLAALKKCFHQGAEIIRIFSNGEFEEDSCRWQQLFNVDLRLYDGKRLAYFLKHSFLFPSVTEIKEIINQEKGRRQKRSSIIKKELMKKTRFSGYIAYSGLLLGMAWYRIGPVLLNLLAGLVLLGFALYVVIQNARAGEREGEEAANPELYFQKNGF
jgi:hypothetical protein